MADTGALIEMGDKVQKIITDTVRDRNLSCGEVLEFLCVLNTNIAQWVAPVLGETPEKILENLRDICVGSLDLQKV